MNMNYGRLSNGRIEYAPSSLDTGDGVKMGAKGSELIDIVALI